jgi:hypothetical protein
LRKFLLVIAGLSLACAAVVALLQSFHKPMSQTYVQDRGYFYRFRADFEVKATGEKIAFDYVAACNIRLTRWRAGGLSNDTTLSPRAMVQATRDGQAVLLQTVDGCHGLTSENGDVPPDLLPLAVWFEDVSDLSAGLGYASEDAYDSPIAKLAFHGARIDRATRDEWEEWRKKSAEQYTERGVLPGPWGYDFPNSDPPGLGQYVRSCEGYRRLQLPDDLRAKLRELWPEGRPRYWTMPSETERQSLGNIIWLLTRRFEPGDGRGGLPIRSGQIISRSGLRLASRPPTEIYPFLWPPLTSSLPMTKTTETSKYVQRLDYRDGAMNGFVVCQRYWEAIVFDGSGDKPTRRQVFEVDGIVTKEFSGKPPGLERPAFVAERDEAVFQYYHSVF